MPTTKASQRAVHKYVKANYDRLELSVPKGDKDRIKARADQLGLSVNAYIKALIDKDMQITPEP